MSELFIGRSTLDLGYICPKFPTEDRKLSATSYYTVAGGPALNAAVTCKSLGGEPILASLIGKGIFADTVREELARYRVQTLDFAPPDAELLPVSSIIVVPGTKTRTVIDRHPPELLVDPASSPVLPADPSIILVDGFVPEIALRIVRKAKERGIPIVFDGGSWKASTSELLPFVDYAIVSERFRPPGVNEPDVIDAIHDFGPKAVAVTRGGQSIFWSLGDARGTIELTSIVAVDTLGAGDIFHGAFCYRFEGDFVKSLEFAAKVSAESCRYVGTREWISHWTNSVS